jgi:hypothetical protein
MPRLFSDEDIFMKVDTNTNRYSIYAGQKQQPAGNADFASQIADISGAGDDASSGDTYDFTDMTPSQMQTAAENLYQSGDIDLTQAFKLQTIGLPSAPWVQMARSFRYPPLNVQTIATRR